MSLIILSKNQSQLMQIFNPFFLGKIQLLACNQQTPFSNCCFLLARWVKISSSQRAATIRHFMSSCISGSKKPKPLVS